MNTLDLGNITIEQTFESGFDPFKIVLASEDTDTFLNLIITEDGATRRITLSPEFAKRLGEELMGFYAPDRPTGLEDDEEPLVEVEDVAKGISRIPVPGGWLYRDIITNTTTFVAAH